MYGFKSNIHCRGGFPRFVTEADVERLFQRQRAGERRPHQRRPGPTPTGGGRIAGIAGEYGKAKSTRQ